MRGICFAIRCGWIMFDRFWHVCALRKQKQDRMLLGVSFFICSVRCILERSHQILKHSRIWMHPLLLFRRTIIDAKLPGMESDLARMNTATRERERRDTIAPKSNNHWLKLFDGFDQEQMFNKTMDARSNARELPVECWQKQSKSITQNI